MHAALLPVKSFASAKGRLGEAISAAEREALTRAMLADMIEALASARCLDRTYVLRAAAALGAETLREDLTKSDPAHGQRAIGGLNRAVADAAERLALAGVMRL